IPLRPNQSCPIVGLRKSAPMGRATVVRKPFPLTPPLHYSSARSQRFAVNVIIVHPYDSTIPHTPRTHSCNTEAPHGNYTKATPPRSEMCRAPVLGSAPTEPGAVPRTDLEWGPAGPAPDSVGP